MTAVAWPRGEGARIGGLARWVGAGLAFLALRGAIAIALLDRRPPPEPPGAATAFMVDLAPMPTAPASEPTDLAPGPQQVETPEAPPLPEPLDEPVPEPVEPEPLAEAPEPVEPAPVPEPAMEPSPEESLPEPEAVAEPIPEIVQAAEAVVPVPSAKPEDAPRKQAERRQVREPAEEAPAQRQTQQTPPDDSEQQPEQRRQAAASRPPAPATTAPPAADAPPAPAAAPAPSSSSRPSATTVNWQSRLLAHLERHKRYPSAARARREEGVVQLRFVIDADGRVLAHDIDRSSGSTRLDGAVDELIGRASPVPAPPPEVAQDRLELVVPVRFFLR
jgi:periplasmic protein TonB